MLLDSDAAYEVVTARDARFDGRLFVGVTSTGVYCRPICRVRTPQKKNCRFFDTPAQAEAAAFRPCMKCRPEIAPGAGHPWSVMDASRTLARQAADALDDQAATGELPSLVRLAEHLGVSDRHLRRIFAAEHGVTPLQYLQTRRLLLAKQLLTDSALPVAQVALASGFKSLRRFNAAFADGYRMSPSRLRGTATDGPRRGRARSDDAALDAERDAVQITLAYRAPYDVAALMRFLERRAIPDVEVVSTRAVRRSVPAGLVAAQPGWLEATFATDAPVVRLRYAGELAPASGRIVADVRRWLDLDAAPQAIDAVLADLPGDPGLRLPGGIDPFELAVRAVLGQQVTVAAARTLARRLVERFGTPFATPWDDITRTFPRAATLASAPVECIAELGIIRTRAAAIVGIAQGWPAIAALLAQRTKPEALIEHLLALPGIGAWTAHYVAMRALGWPDAFPPGDVAVRNALRDAAGAAPTARAIDARSQAWRPWRAYAVLRLWNSLETRS